MVLIVVLRSKLATFGTSGQGTIVRKVYWTDTVTKQGVATVGGVTHAAMPSDCATVTRISPGAAASWQAFPVITQTPQFMPGVRVISSSVRLIGAVVVGDWSSAY